MIENIEKIVEILNNGGVVAYVTDTVWGLGALPENFAGVKKIYDIKKREPQKPLILMSNSTEHLKPYVQEFSPKAQELITKYFPGALTLVVKKSEKTPDYVTSNLDTVGIRVPDNAVFSELCANIPGHVLATTSANLSHQPSAKNYAQALENMSDLADIVIPDYGYTACGLESTVVGVFDDDIKIFRQGEIVISV